jgi:hypothetical protein
MTWFVHNGGFDTPPSTFAFHFWADPIAPWTLERASNTSTFDKIKGHLYNRFKYFFYGITLDYVLHYSVRQATFLNSHIVDGYSYMPASQNGKPMDLCFK